MKVIGDYYGTGYAHLQNLLPRQVVQEFLAQLKVVLDASRTPLQGMFREGMMLKRPAFELGPYEYTPTLTFLWGLTPMMSALTQRELLPTYGYFRVYREGDVCWVHSDRYACEHSLSLTLAYSDDKPWSFEIGHGRLTHVRPVETTFQDQPHSSVIMQPGDAVLYQGVYYRHGRVTPNPNRWSAHLFLHWVDSVGVFRDEAFDRKAPLPPADFQFA